MNPDPHIPNTPDDETLPSEWITALRSLPSEQSAPSATTDATILAEARASLATIRRRKVVHRIWSTTLAAAACLVIALTLFSRHNKTPSPELAATTPEDPYAVILREVTSLFPHQVRAIMTDGGELQIALSDEPVADGAQAVVIEACGNGGCTVVITYVGQTIEIDRQQITIQADKDGVIILESQHDPAPDLQIKSRNI